MVKLESIPPSSNFTLLCFLLAKLAWTQQSRPDIAFDVAISRQITEMQYLEKSKHYVQSVMKIVSYLQKSMHVVLSYPRLNLNFFLVNIFSDTSFAENTDLYSQLGFVASLSDKGNCQLIFWSSHKAKRVSRSVLGSEVMVCADAFD